MVAQERGYLLAKYLQFQELEVWDIEVVQEAWGQRAPQWVKVVRLHDRRGWHTCGECGRRHTEALFEESEPVRFRDCSIGDFPTYLEIHPVRVACCGGTRRERFSFEASGHRMTERFADRLKALAARLPVAVVAAMAGVSWDTVQRLDAEAIAAAGARPEVKDLRLRWIGVDEVSWTGGHRYFTVVTDLKTGQVVWIGDGRGEKGLLPFLRKLGKTGRRRIRGVVSDLGYVGVVERHLPQAIRILDRFHIVQWMNHALEEIRRSVFGRAPRDATGRRLKRGRWLLLTAREKLEHKFKLLLHRLMAANKPLYQGYLLKEQLREILGYPWKYPGAVRSRLRSWVRSARATKLEPLRTVADRIEKHIESIVDGYRYHLPMGLVESINSKIAALRVQARGYRNPEYFKLKIFQRCNLKHNPWTTIIL